MKKGKLIVIEGPDCSGKDSIIDLLSLPDNFMVSREPGGTNIGEGIREILLDPINKEMDDITTFMLFSAARRQHVIEKIVPNINNGINILLNRYYYSSIIYQGLLSNNGIGLSSSFVSTLTEEAVQSEDNIAIPDLSIILYASDFSTIENRIISKQNKDRLELNDIKYFERVNKEYQNIFYNVSVCEIESNKRPEYLFIDISEYDGDKLGIPNIINKRISNII